MKRIALVSTLAATLVCSAPLLAKQDKKEAPPEAYGKGALGSYKMSVGKQPAIKVKRII